MDNLYKNDIYITKFQWLMNNEIVPYSSMMHVNPKKIFLTLIKYYGLPCAISWLQSEGLENLIIITKKMKHIPFRKWCHLTKRLRRI